ncbi:MAG: hypothetical protein MUQ27_11740 [Acidimicrobiia bacterium]|nr:hypothetical protein [Acidimicrobiia bacterium]
MARRSERTHWRPHRRGCGPWFVSYPENWYLGAARYEGIAAYVVIVDGGAIKIANHYWVGFVTYDFGSDS